MSEQETSATSFVSDGAQLASHPARATRVVLCSLLISMLAAPRLVSAAIYGWHDDQGVAHYVSDPANVPSEYRGRIATVVGDVPRRSESPPREPPAREETRAPEAPDVPATDEVLETAFDQGYREGLDSARAVDAGRPWVGTIVQNVQVIERPAILPVFTSPWPLFGPVLARPGRLGRFDGRRRFRGLQPSLSTRSGRFVQGPAGPPPLGAAGPPPLNFLRR